MMNSNELTDLNARFSAADPTTIITWAAERCMPSIAATSSFQTQSVVLLHMISRVRPDLPVVFLDTGYHFPETLAYRDQLVEQLGLTLCVVRPALNRSELLGRYGAALYRHDPDMCCYIHKVAPMQEALRGLEAWITGIRRDQTPHRATMQPVEQLPSGQMKINPLVMWQQQDIWAYSHHHELPAHPLFSQGYLSVGCAPCTIPVSAGQDERSGRWAGTDKTECGLHTETPHTTPGDAHGRDREEKR